MICSYLKNPFLLVIQAVVAVVVLNVDLCLAQGLIALDAITEAHGVKRVAPLSVQMTGTVQRGDGKPETLRVLATRDEELRIEYGTEGKDALVILKNTFFREDGTKATFSKAPPGFAQLDITGLFLIEQLRNRAVRIEQSKDPVTVLGATNTRLVVESERKQLYKSKVSVNDRAEIFVGENGLLTAISREFYQGLPEHHTQAFVFSDYRKNDEGIFLPYRIDLYGNGTRRQTYLIDAYQFDTQLDRQVFIPRRVR